MDMLEENKSLSQWQQELLTADNFGVALRAGRNPEFTTSRISEEKRQVIIKLLAQGVAIGKIAEATNASVHTVLAVRRVNIGDIATEKLALSNTLRDAATVGAAELVERLANPRERDSVRDIAVAVGIAVEKSELLSGAPTARIATDKEITINDVRNYLDSLSQAEVTVIEAKEDAPALAEASS
jgi:DNA-binding transcriptional ArsR family regulator